MAKWLEEHPNFLRVVGDNSFDCYSFKSEKGEYDLYKAKVFDPKNNYPIDWEVPYGGSNNIFEAPDFFKELYIKLFKEYYQENKLRFLIHHARMYLPLVLRAYALSIEEGISFLNHFSDLEMPMEEKTFPVETKQQIIDLKIYLAFFKYELIISNEINETISFTIQ